MESDSSMDINKGIIQGVLARDPQPVAEGVTLLTVLAKLFLQ